MGGADNGVERRAQLMAHIAHKPGFGGGGDLCLLFLCVEKAKDKIKKYDDEQEVQDNVHGEVVVIDEIGELIDMGAVGQKQDGCGQHKQGGAEGKDHFKVVLAHPEEKDHRHGEWEEIEI